MCTVLGDTNERKREQWHVKKEIADFAKDPSEIGVFTLGVAYIFKSLLFVLESFVRVVKKLFLGR